MYHFHTMRNLKEINVLQNIVFYGNMGMLKTYVSTKS